jgi:hypothetical protein
LACGDDPEPHRVDPTVDTTAAGVVHIRNGSGLWSAPDRRRWVVQRERTVGEGEGLLLRNGLIGISVRSDGTTCVLDFPAQEVTCGDAKWRVYQRVARRGSGPGELHFAGGIGWDPSGRLWVASGRGRYDVYGFARDEIHTYRRPSAGLARRVYPLRFDTHGRPLDEIIGGGRTVGFARFDPEQGTLDTLLRIPRSPRGPLAGSPVIRDRQLIRYVLRTFVPKRLWAVNSALHVWTGLSHDYTLYQIDPESGDTVRVVHTQHRPQRSIPASAEGKIDRAFRSRGVDRAEVDVFHPVFQAIHVDDVDNVWVQIVSELDVPGEVWDVFDPQGRYLGEVDLGYGLPRNTIPAITDTLFVGVSLDRNDVPSIVWSRIAKSPEARR